jgi:hypothetical protein
MLPGKPEEMEKTDPTAFNKLGYSNNLTKLSMKKKEKLVVQILATKFHTKSVDEPGSGEEIRLNPIMKDLIINGYADRYHMQAGKSKRSKRQRRRLKLKWLKVLEKTNLIGLTL